MTDDQIDRGLTDFALLTTCSEQSLMSRDHGGEKYDPIAAPPQCLDCEQHFFQAVTTEQKSHAMHANLVERSQDFGAGPSILIFGRYIGERLC